MTSLYSVRPMAFVLTIVWALVGAGLTLPALAQGGGGGGGGSGGGGSDPVAATTQVLDAASALRTRKAIGNLPGIAPFIGGDGGGSVEFILDENSRRVMSRISTKRLWTHLSYQRQTNRREETSTILGASFGSHLHLNPQNVLGGVVLLDQLDQEVRQGSADSLGWLAGAYVAGNYRKMRLRYDLSVLAGQGRSDLSPLGTYTDRVTADRFVVTGRLAKTVNTGNVRLTPSLRLKYANENWPGHVDGGGRAIAARSFEFVDVRAQMQSEISLGQGRNGARLIGIVAATQQEDFEPRVRSTLYGSAEMALAVPVAKDNDLRLSWKRDRIGDAAQVNSNIQLRLTLRF